MGQPKSVAFSCFLYRVVLSLGPSPFRMELQSLLLSDFRHVCLKAHEQAGAEGVFALLPSHILHTFCDISGEHFDLIKSQTRKMLQVIHEFKYESMITSSVSDHDIVFDAMDLTVSLARKKKKKKKKKK
jgi:hypothetical protein